MAEPYGNYRDTDGQPDGDHGGAHLVVRTAAVSDPGDLVSRLPEPAALAWIRHGAGLAGWGEAAPTAAEGNKEIEREGYDGYGRWHLGIDTEASEETKDRYAFPYGDFKKVNRSALIHAKQRAAQNGHKEIEKVAGDLLDRLDKRQE